MAAGAFSGRRVGDEQEQSTTNAGVAGFAQEEARFG